VFVSRSALFRKTYLQANLVASRHCERSEAISRSLNLRHHKGLHTPQIVPLRRHVLAGTIYLFCFTRCSPSSPVATPSPQALIRCSLCSPLNYWGSAATC